MTITKTDAEEYRVSLPESLFELVDTFFELMLKAHQTKTRPWHERHIFDLRLEGENVLVEYRADPGKEDEDGDVLGLLTVPLGADPIPEAHVYLRIRLHRRYVEAGWSFSFHEFNPGDKPIRIFMRWGP